MLLNYVLEKTLESPLDCKEIQPVHPKGNQSWVFIGRTDAEAETPILWPLDVKNWLIWKDADAGKDWRQEKKGTAEDEMVGWHHQLNGHEFGSWWWTRRPGMLQSMGSQRVGHDWLAKLNWTEFNLIAVQVTLKSFPNTTVQKHQFLGHPQIMPDWHIDYFELKLLKKQTMQEAHSHLLLFPWMQKLSLLYERYPINQEMETSL